MMSCSTANGQDQAPHVNHQSHAREPRNGRQVSRQRRKKAADDDDPRPNAAGVAGQNGHSHPLQHWLTRTDIPKPEPLLGHVLTATDRGLLIGPPGLGKTMFMLAFGMAVASGQSFLHWKGTGRAKRVLYIDGEMPRNVIIDRLRSEVRRLGSTPETFSLLSKEDWPDMPPINGQANGVVVGTDYLDRELDIHKPDLVIFDNLQSLLIGDMTKEDAWALVLPWTKRLTQRNIAQMWVHHTGHDESRGYGTRTKEWTVDHVIMLKKNKQTDKDAKVLTFDIAFTKKRMSNPQTYQEFEPKTVTLKDDRWRSIVVNTVPASHEKVLEVLAASHGGMKHKELLEATRLKRSTLADALNALEAKGQAMKHEPSGLWLISNPD